MDWLRGYISGHLNIDALRSLGIREYDHELPASDRGKDNVYYQQLKECCVYYED